MPGTIQLCVEPALPLHCHLTRSDRTRHSLLHPRHHVVSVCASLPNLSVPCRGIVQCPVAPNKLACSCVKARTARLDGFDLIGGPHHALEALGELGAVKEGALSRLDRAERSSGGGTNVAG